MKLFFTLFAFLLAGSSLFADVLKLRDGQMFVGQFLSASRTEIWFQREGTEAPNAMVLPLAQVESLTFRTETSGPPVSPLTQPPGGVFRIPVQQSDQQDSTARKPRPGKL